MRATSDLKLGFVIAIVACAISGMFTVAARAAYADGANVTFVVWLTTVIRVAFLTAFCFATGKQLFKTKADVKQSMIASVFQFLAATSNLAAPYYIPAPLAKIITACGIILLFVSQIFRKRITFDYSTVFVIAAALVGLAFALNVWETQPSASWIGYGIATLAAVAGVCRSSFYEDSMKTKHPMVVGTESFVLVLPLTLLLAFWQMPVLPHSMAGWLWSIGCGLSLTVGVFGMFYGIGMIGAFNWSLLGKSETLYTIFYSILFLGEILDLSQYLGMAAVLASLVSYQLLSVRRAKKAEEAKANAMME